MLLMFMYNLNKPRQMSRSSTYFISQLLARYINEEKVEALKLATRLITIMPQSWDYSSTKRGSVRYLCLAARNKLRISSAGVF